MIAVDLTPIAWALGTPATVAAGFWGLARLIQALADATSDHEYTETTYEVTDNDTDPDSLGA